MGMQQLSEASDAFHLYGRNPTVTFIGCFVQPTAAMLLALFVCF